MGPSERSSTLFDNSASSIGLLNEIMSVLWDGLVSGLFSCKLWVQGLSLFIWAMRTASYWECYSAWGAFIEPGASSLFK